jgi:hypothetical protein
LLPLSCHFNILLLCSLLAALFIFGIDLDIFNYLASSVFSFTV